MQLSEMASLTDTDRKSLLSISLATSLCMYSFFFRFDHVRLRDEEKVCAIITKLQGYVELNGSRSEICRVYLRHIEHLYYKVNNNVFNKCKETLICLKKRETELLQYLFTGNTNSKQPLRLIY